MSLVLSEERTFAASLLPMRSVCPPLVKCGLVVLQIFAQVGWGLYAVAVTAAFRTSVAVAGWNSNLGANLFILSESLEIFLPPEE